MNAGINPTEETLAKFNEFKMKKKLAAIVFKIDKINGQEQVVLDKEFLKDGFKQDDLIEALPTDEGRFIYLDFDYENDDGIKVYKIISILYCPTTAKAAKAPATERRRPLRPTKAAKHILYRRRPVLHNGNERLAERA